MRLFGSGGSTQKQLDLSKVIVRPYVDGASCNQFDCGKKPKNVYLKNNAKKATRRLEHRVFVASLEGSPICLGYYALQVGSDQVPNLPRDRLKYVQNYTAFPAIHLCFLGVDYRYQRQGLGRFLLMDVFERVAKISDHVGFYALTLQSMDDASTRFYESIGFAPYTEGSPQPKMLYPLENIIKLVRGA